MLTKNIYVLNIWSLWWSGYIFVVGKLEWTYCIINHNNARAFFLNGRSSGSIKPATVEFNSWKVFQFSFLSPHMGRSVKTSGTIFCCLLAAALVPASVYSHEAGFGFMSFVAWTAFICTLVDCFLHLIQNIWKKLVILINHPEIYLVSCLLGTVALCLGSITVIIVAPYAQNPYMARASGIFGFLLMLTFAVEAFLHFRSFKEKLAERRKRQERFCAHQKDEAFAEMRCDW